MTGPSDVERHTADLLDHHRDLDSRSERGTPECSCGHDLGWDETLGQHQVAVLAAAGVLVAARPTVPEPDDREALARVTALIAPRPGRHDETGDRLIPASLIRAALAGPVTTTLSPDGDVASDAAPAEPVQDQRPAMTDDTQAQRLTDAEHRVAHQQGNELVCTCGHLVSNYGTTRSLVSLWAGHVFQMAGWHPPHGGDEDCGPCLADYQRGYDDGIAARSVRDDPTLRELAEVCDRYGLPHSAEALDRHLTGNASLTIAVWKETAAKWERRAVLAVHAPVDDPTRRAAAQALRDAADELPWNRQGPERAAHIVMWLRARADRLAATPEDGA